MQENCKHMSCRNFYTNVISHIIFKDQKVETIEMSTDIYSVIERHEVWVHAMTWMNLENIVQSKRSQTQKL